MGFLHERESIKFKQRRESRDRFKHQIIGEVVDGGGEARMFSAMWTKLKVERERRSWCGGRKQPLLGVA